MSEQPHLYNAAPALLRQAIDQWIDDRHGSLAAFAPGKLSELRNQLASQCQEGCDMRSTVLVHYFSSMPAEQMAAAMVI